MMGKTKFSLAELWSWVKAIYEEDAASVVLGVTGLVLLVVTFYVLALSYA